MKIPELANSINQFFEKIIKQKCRILSIIPKDNEWVATCEVNIDPDYTTKRGMGDIVEIYEVHVNENEEVISYSLKETKRKAALDNE